MWSTWKVGTLLLQHGDGSETVGRIAMLGAERLLSDRQRAFKEWLRSPKVILSLKQEGEVAEALRRRAALGAERFFADRQRAFEKRPGGRKVASGLKKAGEVAEARRCIGVLRASTFSRIPSARSMSGRAATRSPCSRSNRARY
jgi:hypothetical protein